jgi:hypothetical protein
MNNGIILRALSVRKPSKRSDKSSGFHKPAIGEKDGQLQPVLIKAYDCIPLFTIKNHIGAYKVFMHPL